MAGKKSNGLFKKLTKSAKIKLQEARIRRLQSEAVKKLTKKKARAAALRERFKQRVSVAREKERIKARLKLERFEQRLVARKAFLPATVKALEGIAKKSKSRNGIKGSLNLSKKSKRKKSRRKQTVTFRI
jgi:hypothetical protein